MPIYERLGLIEVGIEIVQVTRLRRDYVLWSRRLSNASSLILQRGKSGVGTFPVLVLGIDVDPPGTILLEIRVAYGGEAGTSLPGNRPGPGLV